MEIDKHKTTWIQTPSGEWETKHWPTSWLPIYLPEKIQEELLCLIIKHATEARGLRICIPISELKDRLTMAGVMINGAP